MKRNSYFREWYVLVQSALIPNKLCIGLKYIITNAMSKVAIDPACALFFIQVRSSQILFYAHISGAVGATG